MYQDTGVEKCNVRYGRYNDRTRKICGKQWHRVTNDTEVKKPARALDLSTNISQIRADGDDINQTSRRRIHSNTNEPS